MQAPRYKLHQLKWCVTRVCFRHRNSGSDDSEDKRGSQSPAEDRIPTDWRPASPDYAKNRFRTGLSGSGEVSTGSDSETVFQSRYAELSQTHS